MEQLNQRTIEKMAEQFAIFLTDEPRQHIVDSLGFHPVNHARFAHCLTQYHPHHWQVYLSLTTWMK